MSFVQRSIDLVDLDPVLVSSSVSKLEKICESADLNLSHDQLASCVQHLLYVLQVNEYINLTSITDIDDALILHVLDSLLLLPYLSNSSRMVLDMGTGAGFPGLPLSICSDGQFVLLDSVGKKIKFVNAVIQKLGLDNVEACHDRLEVFASGRRGLFDTVVARALAPLAVLLEYARPFLSKGGHLIVAKGTPADDEVEAGSRAAQILGYRLVRNDCFELPSDRGAREVFVYEVTRSSSVKVPRALGAARRNPLV